MPIILTNRDKFKEVFGENISVYGDALHLDRLFYSDQYEKWLQTPYKTPEKEKAESQT